MGKTRNVSSNIAYKGGIRQEFPRIGSNAPGLLHSAVDLDSGLVNSSAFSGLGYNQLTLQYSYTYGAGTAFVIRILGSLDGGVSYALVKEEDVSAPPAITIADAAWTDSTGASATGVVNIPVNYPLIKVQIEATGSPSSDSATVYAFLGAV